MDCGPVMDGTNVCFSCLLELFVKNNHLFTTRLDYQTFLVTNFMKILL